MDFQYLVYKIIENIKIYYSSVIKKGNKLYTDGGRVMSLVYLDENLVNCYNKLYNNIRIDYDEIYYRKDIGYKYISKLKKECMVFVRQLSWPINISKKR